MTTENKPIPLRQSGVMSLWIAIIAIALDQLTKYWANNNLNFNEPVEVISNLNMTLVYNYGAAFSFLANEKGWQVIFFATIAIVVTMVLTVWLAKLDKKIGIEVLALNLIIGGAIGNVIDRIVAGKVTDFIDFYIESWHFAIFNVADIAITCGAALLLLNELLLKPKLQKKIQSAKENVNEK